MTTIEDVNALTFESHRMHRTDEGFTDYFWVWIDGSSVGGLEHNSLPAGHETDDLISLYGFYGSFWLGAPNTRSVLFAKPRERADSFEAAHRQRFVEWSGIRYSDADAAELALIYHAKRSGLRMRAGDLVTRQGKPLEGLLGDVVSAMLAERRLIFFPSGHQDMRRNVPAPDEVDLVVPLSRLGGRLSRASARGLTFNSGYFVWTEEEFVEDPTSRVPDPVGLVIERGVIFHPPIYRRPALTLSDEGKANIESLSMRDVIVAVGGAEFDGSSAITRESAPTMSDGRRLVIIGRRVVGEVPAGRVALPPGHGFFLDVSEEAYAAVESGDVRVSYRFASGRRIREASQGSLQLLADGRILDLEMETRQTSVTETPATVGGIPPNHLTSATLLSDRRAQTAVGLDESGRALLCVVTATEPRSADPRFDSLGAPLKDVARFLHERGCVDAIAFDGGGSAVAAFAGSLLTRPSDRFDVRHAPRERIVPGGWVLPDGYRGRANG